MGKKGGFGRRDSRARRWREDPPAAPRILRGPGGRGSARARGCGRVSTSSRVLRLRLRLARVFSPAVSVRVACVWRAGGGEARRVSSRRGGVGFDAAGRAVVRSRCARGAGERTIETTRTRNRAALFVVTEAGLLVVTRAVLVSVEIIATRYIIVAVNRVKRFFPIPRTELSELTRLGSAHFHPRTASTCRPRTTNVSSMRTVPPSIPAWISRPWSSPTCNASRPAATSRW